MACGVLTKGRGLDCNRISGGVKYIYFGVYDEFTAPIQTTGIVQVDGEITKEAMKKLQNGVEITVSSTKYQTLPCKAFALENEPNLPSRGRNIRDSRHGPTSWVSITLNEGKKRQIRKMTAAVGFPTLRLVRVRIGDIHLSNMNPGDVLSLANFDEIL